MLFKNPKEATLVGMLYTAVNVFMIIMIMLMTKVLNIEFAMMVGLDNGHYGA